MADDLRVSAAQGDMAAIKGLLMARCIPHAALPGVRNAARELTPEILRTWLDAAQEHRPNSASSDGRSFTYSLGHAAFALVVLGEQTGEPWNELLCHPVFTSSRGPRPEWAAPAEPGSLSPLPTWYAPAEPGSPPPRPASAEPESVPPQSVPTGCSGPPPLGGIPEPFFEVAAFSAAVGLVPFLQTIATQAAQRTFDAARATIRQRLDRGEARVFGPNLVIEVRGGRMEFRVPSDIPSAALQALVDLGEHGLEELAKPDGRGRRVVVSWDAASQRWVRIVS